MAKQIKLDELGFPKEEHILLKTSRMQKKAESAGFIINERKMKITRIDAKNYDTIKMQ